jgi:hypothetical protein
MLVHAIVPALLHCMSTYLKILKECIKWLQFTNPKNDTNSNDRKSNATKIDTGPDKGQP